MRAFDTVQVKAAMLFPILISLCMFLAGCKHAIEQKKAFEYKGWKIEVLNVETSKREIPINELVINNKSGTDIERVKPKGMFLLVTLSAQKLNGETLWFRKSLLIDDKGQQFPLVAAGGKGTGAFILI